MHSISQLSSVVSDTTLIKPNRWHTLCLYVCVCQFLVIITQTVQHGEAGNSFINGDSSRTRLCKHYNQFTVPSLQKGKAGSPLLFLIPTYSRRFFKAETELKRLVRAGTKAHVSSDFPLLHLSLKGILLTLITQLKR